MSARTPDSSTASDVKAADYICVLKDAAQAARFAIYALLAVVGGLL